MLAKEGRIHPSKRAFLRKYPKPAPPPDGMMFYHGKLVSVQWMHEQARKAMGMSPEPGAKINAT